VDNLHTVESSYSATSEEIKKLKNLNAEQVEFKKSRFFGKRERTARHTEKNNEKRPPDTTYLVYAHIALN